MAKTVKNTREADITVNTPLGAFVFQAGQSIDLEDDRFDALFSRGKWYFAEGDLVVVADLHSSAGVEKPSEPAQPEPELEPKAKTTAQQKKSK